MADKSLGKELGCTYCECNDECMYIGELNHASHHLSLAMNKLIGELQGKVILIHNWLNIFK